MIVNWHEYFYYDAEYGHLVSKCAGKLPAWMNDSGYWLISFQGEEYREHRIIWNMLNPEDPVPERYATGDPVINHIDGNPGNNHIWNLEKTTQFLNSQPSRRKNINRNNNSGRTGVFFDNSKGLWVASGKLNFKRDFIEYFYTFEEACRAREAWEKGGYRKRSVYLSNTSGVKGVSWNPHRGKSGKWHSYIKLHGKRIEAYFDDFFEAVCWRKSKENDLQDC